MTQKQEFHIAFSGHRPALLNIRNAYDYNQPFYQVMQSTLRRAIEKILQENPNQIIVGHSGMAQGADFIWSQALIQLKEEHPENVRFVADLATKNQSNSWSDDQKQIYQNLLSKADEIIDHSQNHQSKNQDVFDARDREMIEQADQLISVLNPNLTNSNTAKAIKYAKEIHQRKPLTLNTNRIFEKLGQTPYVTKSKTYSSNNNQSDNKLDEYTKNLINEAKKLVNPNPSMHTNYAISLTGHRVWQNDIAKLDPTAKTDKEAYDMSRPAYRNIQQHLENIIEESLKNHSTITCRSGMALGADTLWAEAIVKMKEKYPDRIRFAADIPSLYQASQWKMKSKKRWLELLQQADEVNDWNNGKPWEKGCEEIRNQNMIKRCDTLIAIFNGTKGGTYNGYHDGINYGKQIYRVDPKEFTNSVPRIPMAFKKREPNHQLYPTSQKFEQDYAYLSNDYPASIQCSINGEKYTFSCVEAAFQAAINPKYTKEFVQLSGKEAKVLGTQLQPDNEWNPEKLEILNQLTFAKFAQNEDLKEKLLSIDGPIINNTTNDTILGVKDGLGENNLGKCLMTTRASLGGHCHL